MKSGSCQIRRQQAREAHQQYEPNRAPRIEPAKDAPRHPDIEHNQVCKSRWVPSVGRACTPASIFSSRETRRSSRQVSHPSTGARGCAEARASPEGLRSREDRPHGYSSPGDSLLRAWLREAARQGICRPCSITRPRQKPQARTKPVRVKLVCEWIPITRRMPSHAPVPDNANEIMLTRRMTTKRACRTLTSACLVLRFRLHRRDHTHPRRARTTRAARGMSTSSTSFEPVEKLDTTSTRGISSDGTSLNTEARTTFPCP